MEEHHVVTLPVINHSTAVPTIHKPLNTTNLSMDDDDDDTVVGTCLHCNAPPPPRSGSRGSSYSGGGGGGGPCSGSTTSITATSSATSPSAATRVQVSCDDCRSFICDGCHWCHEFQANHEIRVCDRCDAFYCRGCDEMDQCEDCSEVVCNTCSTLMSCKFCGCGLCEDCATACGRCGIVLCARDAKFAVECDTCRMSYCLVCLASGTKDPCVRCGHRPSKRVEQLVHLRLKSIYKAFKQSGASAGPGSGGGSGSGCRSGDGGGRDSSAMGGKYSSALRSLTESNDSSSSSKDTFSNFDQNMASEVAAVLQTASNSMANSDGDSSDGHGRRSRGKRISSHDHSPSSGSARNRSSSRASNAAAAERYFRKTQADMEAAAAAAEAEAEAAAAALLAELDEAALLTATTSKKSKKKKKKKEKKMESVAEQQKASEPTPDTVKSDEKDGKNSSNQKKKGSKKAFSSKSSKNNDPPPIDDESSDEEMNFEQLIAGAKGSNKPSKKEKREKEEKEESKPVAPPTNPKPETPPPVEAAPAQPATTADFDAELAILLSNDDEEGLETFLANLKGVPGLGAARKTAKKALKKIREARKPPSPPPEPEKLPQPQSSVMNTETKAATKPAVAKAVPRTASTTAAAESTPPPATFAQHEPLLRVVSRTQSNIGAASSRDKSVPASSRGECVMHMSPVVVGWVIGKGGSRIRDMMEESGAKIWIDQESMGENEARVVYVSGKRTSVDSAVRMVKDLVSKAPVASSAATPTGVAPAPATVPTTASTSSAKSAPTPSASPSVQSAPTVAEAPKEPASFAAAISSGASIPAAAAPPAPAATPTKQSAASTQGWALPETSANTHVVPHQAAPQSVKPAAADPKPVIRSVLEAGGEKLFPDTVIKELACDPRFVALLIGRRGWTVKNIQTESGADLHIDQTVDPPKIIMSGEANQVVKAEHLVREVLKYPHHQLHQENPNRLKNDVMVSATDNNMGISNRAEQNSLRNLQMMPNQPSNPQSIPLPTTSLHRDISSSTPTLLDELQLQQQQQKPNGAMHLPSGYPQFQHQQHQTSNLGLFQDSSSAATRTPEFLPNSHNHSANMNPPARTQSQDSWSQHGQAPTQMRTQQQYSTLPPFTSAQMPSGSDQYLLSNSNQNPPHHHQPQHENLPQRQQQSSFGMPPQDQHLRFPQEPVQHQTHVPPAQAPSTRSMNDYMSTGNSSHTMNGWELPASGSSMGGTWNQSSHRTPVDSEPRRPSFQAHAPQAPLSNNPFQSQTPVTHFTAPSQPTNIPVSDDSQMVDDLFASLGTDMSLSVSDNDGSGLLNALNSVSLGGVGTQQQENNLGNLISGWTGEDSKNNPFFQQSRLGDYREGS